MKILLAMFAIATAVSFAGMSQAHADPSCVYVGNGVYSCLVMDSNGVWHLVRTRPH